MLTVVTARPPSTYTFTTSLQFISIATTVTVKRSFCVTFKPTNKAGKQVSKPCLFSLCLAFVLSLKLSSKEKNKNFGAALPVVAARRAKVVPAATVPQRCELRSVAVTRPVATTRPAVALPRRVLQQRRSVAATRATTMAQRCRDASCSIITLQACSVATLRAWSAVATRACTVATPRCHYHRHKAHRRTAAW